MTVKTNKFQDRTALDRKAHDAAVRIAGKHGLRDRAKTTWHSMADELLEEVQPAIEEQAKTEADAAAKTRLRDVLALPEASERRDLAARLALDTDSTVEQIKEMLEATPKTRAHSDPLATLMAGRSPGVSSDDGSPGDFEEVDEHEAAAQAILNA